MSITYEVVATRSGDWWAIEVVSGLRGNMLGVSQARRLTEVEDVARNVIVDLLEVEAHDVDLHIRIDLPPDLHRAVELFRDAEVIEATARHEAAMARSRAAAAFLAARLTMREAGELLGVSHQRIKQLADRAPDNNDPVDLVASIGAALDEARRSRAGETVAAQPRRTG